MRDADPPLQMSLRIPGYRGQHVLLPYLETVRRASAWRALGFEVTLTSFGWPELDRSKDHQFRLTNDLKIDVDEAMRTGSKVLTHPLRVYDYFWAGCPLSEFGFLPRDVIDYCEGRLLQDHGYDADALPFLESAVRLNPAEVRYREPYYPLRLRLGDLSAIAEECAYFCNDIAHVVPDRFDQWAKALIKANQLPDVRAVADQVRSHFERLCLTVGVADIVVEHRYSEQSAAYLRAKRAQFERVYEKVLARVEMIEAKAAAKSARR